MKKNRRHKTFKSLSCNRGYRRIRRLFIDLDICIERTISAETIMTIQRVVACKTIILTNSYSAPACHAFNSP